MALTRTQTAQSQCFFFSPPLNPLFVSVGFVFLFNGRSSASDGCCCRRCCQRRTRGSVVMSCVCSSPSQAGVCHRGLWQRHGGRRASVRAPQWRGNIQRALLVLGMLYPHPLPIPHHPNQIFLLLRQIVPPLPRSISSPDPPSLFLFQCSLYSPPRWEKPPLRCDMSAER